MTMVATRRLDWIDESWDSQELPPLSFALVAGGGCELPLSSVTGVVKHVDEQRLDIGTPGFREDRAHVDYHLPASLDLRSLLGRRVRVDVVQRVDDGQTLTISADTGSLWLAAYCGKAPFRHGFGGNDLCVRFFDNPGEALLVECCRTTRRVACGESARVPCGARVWIVEFVSLTNSGDAAYFVADATLWH